MVTSLSPETFAAISLGLVIGLIVLLVLQIITGRRVQKLTQPIYEYVRAQSQAEADRIVSGAREEARKVVADSQAAVAVLVEKQRGDIEAHARTYQKALDELMEASKQMIHATTEKAQGAHAELLQHTASTIDAEAADVKSRMEHVSAELDAFLKQNQSQVTEIRRVIEEGGRTMVEGFTHTFEDISTVAKKHIDERIEALLSQAATEVAAYRDARKHLVDEHMADLVTETSKIVLHKALTPDEHAELVDRALKEAHASGMI